MTFMEAHGEKCSGCHQRATACVWHDDHDKDARVSLSVCSTCAKDLLPNLYAAAVTPQTAGGDLAARVRDYKAHLDAFGLAYWSQAMSLVADLIDTQRR